MKDLGGRRNPKAGSNNLRWHNAAFRGYADYMQTEEFITAVSQLETMGFGYSTAFMCSEALWWRCHRSLISDYLKIRCWTVFHIMDISKANEHPYTSASRIEDNKLFYSE